MSMTLPPAFFRTTETVENKRYYLCLRGYKIDADRALAYFMGSTNRNLSSRSRDEELVPIAFRRDRKVEIRGTKRG